MCQPYIESTTAYSDICTEEKGNKQVKKIFKKVDAH